MAERDAPRPPSSRGRDGGRAKTSSSISTAAAKLLQDNRVRDAPRRSWSGRSPLQPRAIPRGRISSASSTSGWGSTRAPSPSTSSSSSSTPMRWSRASTWPSPTSKTGQPAPRRCFELRRWSSRARGTSRAWGYLGLAFQRLGDYERASYAFQAGGHDGMARRLIDMTATGGALSIRPEPPAPAKAEMRRAAGDALAEMDGDAPFRTDESKADGRARFPAPASPAAPASRTGTWQTMEPGREGVPHDGVQAAPILPSLAPAAGVHAFDGAPPASLREAAAPRAPRRPSEAVRDASWCSRAICRWRCTRPASCWCRSRAASPRASRRCGRCRTGPASRAPAPCSSSLPPAGGCSTSRSAGPRRRSSSCRGRVELSLPGRRRGGGSGPSRSTRRRSACARTRSPASEAGVAYENGRLPVGDGDAIPMVQLRGPGIE